MQGELIMTYIHCTEKTKLDQEVKTGFWRNKMKQYVERGGLQRLSNVGLVLFLAGFLGACDKVSNNDAPPETLTRTSVAADVEVQYFQDNFYNNVMGLSCRNCHSRTGVGAGAPAGSTIQGAFADENVNTAFASANSMLPTPVSDSLFDPGSTVFVTKVLSGHNCWTASCANDAATMTAWLQAWADATQGTGSQTLEDTLPVDTNTELTLVDPPIVEVSDRRVFDRTPEDVNRFQGLYTLLDTHCSECHNSSTTANTPQAPYFADADINAAYDAVVASGVVDLNVPVGTAVTDSTQSRVVFRLGAQNHNCWDVCATDAGEIRTAIETWAAAITPVAAVNSNYRISKAMELNDGQVSSGGSRTDRYVIAKYEFKEGRFSSNTYDTSGIAPAIDLQLFGSAELINSYGVRIQPGSVVRSTNLDASRKLHDTIVARGEYSIEAWVVPASLSQQGGDMFESAPIVTYSAGGGLNRNFTLAQYQDDYRFYNRLTPFMASADFVAAEEKLQTSLQHVVVTFTEAEGRKIYINGVQVTIAPDPDPAPRNNLIQWDLENRYLLSLGADTDRSNPWAGIIRFVAIHRAALPLADIEKNFQAGVGQKYNLLFNVNDIMPAYAGTNNPRPNYYIWMQASEFDDYSYLFADPKFITLNPDVNNPVSFEFSGMRVGINGQEVEVGQAFDNYGKPARLAVNTTAAPGEPVDLTTLAPGMVSGSVFSKHISASTDQFFLTFEHFAGTDETVVRDTGLVAAPPLNYAPGDTFVVGLRTFAEISASMAQLVQVNQGAASVVASYQSLKEALPAEENVTSFASSHQIAIASLAGMYCDNRVEGSNLEANADSRETYFNVSAGFFNSNVADWIANRTTIIPGISQKIVEKMVNTTASIDTVSIENEVTALGYYMLGYGADGTTANGQSCQTTVPSGTQDCTSSVRTRAIVKAMCTSVLGSAVVTHQ